MPCEYQAFKLQEQKEKNRDINNGFKKIIEENLPKLRNTYYNRSKKYRDYNRETRKEAFSESSQLKH